MNANPSPITADQRNAIKSLREGLADLLIGLPEFDTDFDLLRWLQGHDNDVQTTLSKLRTHLLFLKCWQRYKREQNFVPNPLLLDDYPRGLLGLTGRDNNFLMIEPMGLLDMEGLCKSVQQSCWLLNCYNEIEVTWMIKLREHEARTGQQSGVIMIQDLAGLRLDLTALLNVVGGPYRAHANFMSSHFAEVLRKVVVVNSPTFIYWVWKLLGPLLPKKTREKVDFLGPDWKNEVLQYVQPEALPVHWGGTMVDADGDERCRSRVVVPHLKYNETHFWKDDALEKDLTDPQTVVVAAGAYESITVEVKEPNTKIYWRFETNSDFSFGVYFCESADETNVERMEMVFPLLKLPGPLWVPEEERFLCTRAGYYKLRFGNESAWWRNLSVECRVKVLLS